MTGAHHLHVRGPFWRRARCIGIMPIGVSDALPRRMAMARGGREGGLRDMGKSASINLNASNDAPSCFPSPYQWQNLAQSASSRVCSAQLADVHAAL